MAAKVFSFVIIQSIEQDEFNYSQLKQISNTPSAPLILTF